MERKGFPESYDGTALVRFLSDIKAGKSHAEAPVYSHLTYDVVPGEEVVVDRPDILIVEGLNVLLPNKLGRRTPFVSDFFDFSVYLHAEDDDLERWYIERFMRLRETAFRDPRSFFKKYADLSDEQARETAHAIWTRTNLRNLHENIQPTRARANLVLTTPASSVYRKNFAYSPKAVTMATADLVLPRGVHEAARRQMDGISMRLWEGADIVNDAFPTRSDVLYGYVATYPQLATRVWG
jgi:uridine kinase